MLLAIADRESWPADDKPLFDQIVPQASERDRQQFSVAARNGVLGALFAEDAQRADNGISGQIYLEDVEKALRFADISTRTVKALRDWMREHRLFPEKANGRYSEAQLNIARTIEEALAQGKPVTAGTYKTIRYRTPGEPKPARKHAYTVTRVERRRHGRHEMIFIHLDNPWRRGGLVSTIADDGKLQTEDSPDDGKLVIDLDDFTTWFSVTTVGLVP